MAEKGGTLAFAVKFGSAAWTWSNCVRRHALTTLVASLAVTAGLFFYTAQNLGINTDTEGMLSKDLAFRKNLDAQREAFPQHSKAIVVVIDGPDADRAGDATTALVRDLERQPELFKTAFYPAADPFFRRNGLLYLSAEEISSLTTKLAQAQGFLATLANDPSLRGLTDVLVTALEALAAGDVDSATATDDMADMLRRVAEVTDAHTAGSRQDLPWTEVIGGTALSDSVGGKSRHIVVVQPVLNHSSLAPASASMREIRRAAERLGLTPENGVRVRLTGAAALSTEELSSVRDGMGMVGLLSLVLVTLLLAIALRSVRYVLALVGCLIVGLIWTAAFATAAIGELNLISVAFAVLFIGLGVDFGIHLVLRYREEMSLGEDDAAALEATVRATAVPLALCALTGMIGFFAFLPTDYRGLSELGLISGVGLAIGLFACFTLIPAVLSAWKGSSTGAKTTAPVRTSARPAAGDSRTARTIVLGAVVVCLLAAPLALDLRFDADPMNLRDPETESVQTAMELMQDDATRDVRAVGLAANLAEADVTARALRAVPQVRKVVTLSSLVPDDQDRKLEIIEQAAFLLAPLLVPLDRMAPPDGQTLRQQIRRLAASLRAASRSHQTPPGVVAAARDLLSALDRLGDTDPKEADLRALQASLINRLPTHLADLSTALQAERFDLDDLPANVRERMVAADGRARIEIYPRARLDSTAERREFVDAVQAVVPDVSGTPVIILAAQDAVTTAIVQASVIALIGIFVLLIAVLRSASDSALVLIPLLIAALLTSATAVLFDLPLNFANVIVLPLLLGLGVDSGIHIVLRDRETFASRTAYASGSTPAGTLMRTSTPRAVLFSGLTTVASFGSLSISNHIGTASMGKLLTVTLAWTLASTLILLPALLTLRRQGLRSQNGVSSHADRQRAGP